MPMPRLLECWFGQYNFHLSAMVKRELRMLIDISCFFFCKIEISRRFITKQTLLSAPIQFSSKIDVKIGLRPVSQTPINCRALFGLLNESKVNSSYLNILPINTVKPKWIRQRYQVECCFSEQ